MPLFLITLRQESENHTVEEVADGFLIHRREGREDQFDDLARQVINAVGPFAAFPRLDSDGRYDCVHIIPTA